MMKKIVALLVLCALLCVCAAAAFAATVKVEFNAGMYSDPEDGAGSMESIQVEAGGKLKLPKNGFKKPDWSTKKFFGWRLENGNLYYAEEEITVDRNMKISAYWVDEGTYTVEYWPGRGTGERWLFAEGSGSHQLLGVESFGYTPPSADGKKEKFAGWLVEGDDIDNMPGNNGPDVGWLFRRALADNFKKQLNLKAGDSFLTGGAVKITAQWGEGSGGGSNGGTNGGTIGGAGNGANGGAAISLPQTGDSSNMELWMVLMGLSGVTLIVLRKRVNN